MVSEDFGQVGRGRLAPQPTLGHQLVTVSVLYYLPDHPSLLNEFLWQTMDLGPRYPRIGAFLDFWRREIEAVLHSVRVAHQHLIGPAEWRAVDGIISIN